MILQDSFSYRKLSVVLFGFHHDCMLSYQAFPFVIYILQTLIGWDTSIEILTKFQSPLSTFLSCEYYWTGCKESVLIFFGVDILVLCWYL